MNINYKKLSEKAVAPTRATEASAGYNLTCTRITTEINECGQLVLVYHTDLTFEVPEGYYVDLRPCISIAAKSLRMCSAPTAIYSDNNEEVVIRFISTTDVLPAVYKEGDVFAQAFVHKIEDSCFIEIERPVDEKEELSAASGSDQKDAEGEKEPDAKPAGTDMTATEQAAGEENTPEQA